MSEVRRGCWFGTFLPELRRSIDGGSGSAGGSGYLSIVRSGSASGREILRELCDAARARSGCATGPGGRDLRALRRGGESRYKILQVLRQADFVRRAGLGSACGSRHDADGGDVVASGAARTRTSAARAKVGGCTARAATRTPSSGSAKDGASCCSAAGSQE